MTNTTSEEDQEQYKVRNDLRTYGRWFTFDEAWALANAWETGYIDYDGFREVLVNRVSKFSGEYVNAINNVDMLSDGTQQLRSALDDMESGIRHNLEVADARPSDELLSAANNAIAAVDGFNDPISIVENSELLRNAIGYDALVQQHGEDEMTLSDAIGAALKGIVESAQTENVMSDNTGAEFTLPQVDELRKAVDLYEKFGAYGYDFVMAATPEYLKKFGIDLEGEGLTASLEEYMDELTEGAWRDAYASDGLGFVGTVNAGLVKGYQGVGNAVAGGSRMIRDGIYSAAMNEGVPFNSPNVQNAVIANQQATAALRSDLAKQQEKVKLARTACERAQKEYDEAREEAKKQYQEEAATTAKKAAMRIDEARALLQSEAAKQGLVPKDELNSKPGRRYVDDTATIPFDGDIANPDNERIESEEEEQYLNYNTLDDSSRDNAPEPDDAASNGTDSKDYSADFDLKAKSLADVFADISDLSKTKKLRDARQQAREAAINVGKLRAELNLAVGSQKPRACNAIRDALAIKSDADAEVVRLNQEYRKICKSMAGSYSAWKYVSLKKSDLKATLNAVLARGFESGKHRTAQEDRLLEDYKAGNCTTEHLRAILLENTDLNYIDDSTYKQIVESRRSTVRRRWMRAAITSTRTTRLCWKADPCMRLARMASR